MNSIHNSGTHTFKNEDLGYAYDASHNLAYRTNHTLLQTFTSDPVNELATVVRSGTLTVMGSVTGAIAHLAVNGRPAEIYGDGSFASAEGFDFTNHLFITLATNAAGTLVGSTRTAATLPPTVNFNYDLNGNLTGDGLRLFNYDDENQLINVTVAGQWKSDFVYDGMGRRRIAQDYAWQGGAWNKTNEVHYVCDGTVVMQERDASGNVLVTYTRGLDLSGTRQGAGGIGGLLARTDGNGSTYYHSDAGGNITAMVDGSGNVVARYLYDPFGNLLAKSGPMADVNRYRFSSKEEIRGLYYYGLRFYEPNLQRWPNRDPIGEAGGINLYQFVGNNPINRIDPLGLAWYDGIAGLAGLGGPGTFSASWGGFGSSWSDSANSIGQALGGALAGNWDQVANAYDSGVFGQTQDADAFTYYGTRAAVATAAAATAAAVAVDAAGLSTRIACHGPHHGFGPLGRLPHVQLNWWRAGVKGSGGALRIPVPPGTPGFPP